MAGGILSAFQRGVGYRAGFSAAVERISRWRERSGFADTDSTPGFTKKSAYLLAIELSPIMYPPG